jgi:hypothetical protein
MLPSAAKLDETLARMDYGRALKAALTMTESNQQWIPYAQPLLDAVSLFEELGVSYALIGGIAAMYYGRARFTEDVDFIAAPGHMEILAAHPAELDKHHFQPTHSDEHRHQSGVRVDIWKDEHADAIIQRAKSVELAGRLLRVIEPHDLIAMKLRARRLKDDYDISEIAKKTAIDPERLKQLVTPEQFQQFNDLISRP